MSGPAQESDTLEARLAAEWDRATALIGDLKDELAAIAETTAAGPDDEHDAEGSTVAYERARVQALLAHAERAVAEIEAATSRAAAMTDGVRCRRCRSPIPDERLIALPTTQVCVFCAAAP